MKKILALSAVAAAALIALAGCSPASTGSGGSMPGMNHGPAGMSATTAPAAADHNAADTVFAQMMIPHHAQALEMSEIMLKKQDLPASVTGLATKIKAAQGTEIDKMTGWLRQWNESTQMSGNHGMTGMMGADDVSKLDQAPGTEAAKLFLTQMIAHHEVALMMAKTEEAQGKNPDAVSLSKSIVTSQEAEIQEMKDLLRTL